MHQGLLNKDTILFLSISMIIFANIRISIDYTVFITQNVQPAALWLRISYRQASYAVVLLLYLFRYLRLQNLKTQLIVAYSE